LGTYVLSAGYYDAYYLKGQKVRSLIAQDFRDAFAEVDAILTPTSPVPPFKLGERADGPLQMYLADIYTVTGSLAGVPGISVPCGKIGGKLPVGLQIFGAAFGEARVLQLAHAFEQAGGAAVLALRARLDKTLPSLATHYRGSWSRAMRSSARRTPMPS